MKKDMIEIKYQSSNICYALLRNLNNNFLSVSFEFVSNGKIQVKIILKQRRDSEDEYIYDMMAELMALQQQDNVLKPIVNVGNNHHPLTHIVYQQSSKGELNSLSV